MCWTSPRIGLHQRDNERLLATLRRLRDIGNTVLVVEHDEDAIRAADHLVDIGPAAGAGGGRVIAQGTPAEVAANPASLTGDYLSGRRRIEVPATPAQGGPQARGEGGRRPRQQPEGRLAPNSRSAPSPASPASPAAASPRW